MPCEGLELTAICFVVHHRVLRQRLGVYVLFLLGIVCGTRFLTCKWLTFSVQDITPTCLPFSPNYFMSAPVILNHPSPTLPSFFPRLFPCAGHKLEVFLHSKICSHWRQKLTCCQLAASGKFSSPKSSASLFLWKTTWLIEKLSKDCQLFPQASSIFFAQFKSTWCTMQKQISKRTFSFHAYLMLFE